MSTRAMSVDVDGISVNAVVTTNQRTAATPQIVLIHGAQSDRRAWDKPMQWFAARGYHAMALDLPGHGNSTGAALADIAHMGEWLGKLLDQLLAEEEAKAGPKPSFVLVGHSMGSLTALECASRQTSRVAALVLVGTAYPMRVSAGLLEQTRSDEAKAIAQIAQWSYAKDADDANETARALRRERVEQAEQFMASQHSGVLHNDLNACNSYQNGLMAASQIRCPALIIAGSKDQMTAPKYALGLQQALGADFHTIEGTGHAMMDECGDTVCEIIDQFLSQRNSTPPQQESR